MEKDIEDKVEPEDIINNRQGVDIITDTEQSGGISEGEEKYVKTTLVGSSTEGGEPSMKSMTMNGYDASMKMNDYDYEGTNKNKCTSKRGGRCIQHGMLCKKNVISKRAWVKGKNGIFGWRTTRQTTYLCTDY